MKETVKRLIELLNSLIALSHSRLIKFSLTLILATVFLLDEIRHRAARYMSHLRMNHIFLKVRLFTLPII